MIRPLTLGGVPLKNNLILAPMAGYGDPPFRRLCAEYGAGLTVTEMISVKGLVYKGEKTRRMLAISDAERPHAAVQLFGRDLDAFETALTGSDALDGFSIIDINMGCPVPKITKQGEGSALLKDAEHAAALVRTTVAAAGGRPVGVKMRTGYYDGQIIAVEFALKMQDAGAAFITVHGRTTQQKYAGRADWTEIERVKHAVSVPVIGSGDVDITNYVEREQQTDGLMIGRGAIGRPWIFAAMQESFTPQPLLDVMVRHIGYMQAYGGTKYAAVNFRKHLTFYLNGVRGAREIKLRAFTLERADALVEVLSAAEELKGVYTSAAGHDRQ